MAFLVAMNKQRSGGEPDPDRWTEPSKRNFDELAAKREQMRGRR